MSASPPTASELGHRSDWPLSADFVAEIGDQNSEAADAIF
jgi:hypothetical protein